MLLCYRGLYSQHIVDCNNSSLISKNAIQVDKYHYILSLYFYFGRINTLVSLLIYYKFVKKIFLIAIALISIATTQVFGMYGVSSGDWIGFLTHGNQFRARLDQLGFTLGNDMIKGTFGFHTDRGNYGAMLNSVAANTETTSTGSSTGSGFFYNFVPTISMGLAYTSSLISVGVGYNATIGQRWNRYNGKDTSKKVEAVAHTPVLVLNALDNAFRMAIPIQVVNLTYKDSSGNLKASVTAVSLDAQFRYYTGLEMLPQVRLYLKYGNYSYNYKAGDVSQKGKYAESFGFDLRFYFGSMVEEVALQPIVKLAYNGALGKQHNKTAVTALSALDNAATTIGSAASSAISGIFPTSTYGGSAVWKQGAWDLTLAPSLGLTANSDIVSLYLEPSLGLKITQNGDATDKVKEVYALTYGAYAEIYITPLKNLEWYFEADVSGDSVSPTQGVKTPVKFASSTGITWYLPQL